MEVNMRLSQGHAGDNTGVCKKKCRWVVFPRGLRPPGAPHLGLLGQAAWGLSPVGVLWILFETRKYFLMFS